MDITLPEKLKKMMTAMAETEKENPPLWGMGVVAVTVLVRFLHTLAQREMATLVQEVEEDVSPTLPTFLLACAQIAAAFGAFRVSGLSLAVSPTNREAAAVGVLAYGGGLFLSGYLLWSDSTAAVACYGAQEPVLCMLLLLVAARIPTDRNRAVSVGCFCLGAALLSANFTVLGGVPAVLRVVASVFLLVRNMVIKHMYDSGVTFILRSQGTLVATAAGGTVAAVVVSALVSTELVMAGVMAAVVGVVTVTLLHLTLTLLWLYDTLTVAVFMLWAQVLESVFLVAGDARPLLLAVLVGAALFAAGHYFYFKDGLESGTVHLNIKQVGVSELFTRLQFVMYAAAILGLAATLLKPYIADTGVLSYVGLDRIARKLLSVTPTQQS